MLINQLAKRLSPFSVDILSNKLDMKKLIVLLILVVSPLLLAAQVKKVAILETVDKEGTISYPIKLMLRANLSKAITNTNGYEAYDRTDMDAIMNEQDFQRTGMVSDDQIKRLGEMTGASYVLVAEAVKVDEQNMFITAKILDVESARTERTDNELMNTSPAEIQNGCASLAAKLFGRSANVSSSSSSSGFQARSGSNDYVESTLGLNMKMVYVEGGQFQMGATSEQSGAKSDESPVHSVTLDSYYISATEVTQAQWQAVMGTTIHQQASKAGDSVRSVGSDYPMYYVSWEEARAFCSELSALTGKTYLLPTEAQWEYAARGGKKSRSSQYSGSYSVDAVAWYKSNSGGRQHPVGKLRANELGLYDMSGNVWEWCMDWKGLYSSDAQFNPTGPSSGSDRVLRGGSYLSLAGGYRVASRSGTSPSSRSKILGFRVVCLP